MNYLLDTCLLSEFMKPQGNRGVINWFKAQDDETLYISVLAIGEIRKGIKKLGATKRSDELRTWLDSVVFRFDSRILAFDISMANRWGDLIANLESKGRPMPVIDSLMAATALEHNLTIVTRNEDDFEPTGAKVLNLWQ
ncbi:MAG TPA: type II toxin-antitoxin system VapC family toxin [Pyrinomonadaceae bacterium]|nr:type II toxin-antitoxin system VapC family toxin [Chloracidobacterium sp.]MBK9767635.1 type II toxin-antitoxin system VapC family toxin [Chloracidobacterium sp.]MBL0240894.1 type II toxin-antitoxin system VapC family toxin [Chloracidobacterium sp.]HQY68771.1 type II toxin-antitoxin system VapC family toxin [Pyrinomonadaceae bacterium]